MIFARVLDQTMSDDYFKAMEQIEKQLTLPLNPFPRSPFASELLVLLDTLLENVKDLSPSEVIFAVRNQLIFSAEHQAMENRIMCPT